MWGKGKHNEERPRADACGSATILGRGASFNGVLRVNGSLRVDGEIQGQVYVVQGLVVGPEGVIKADVATGTAVIAGRIHGRVHATGKVELHKGGRLDGDVHASSFQIEDGAHFQGNCTMGESAASAAQSATGRPATEEKLKVVGP